MLEVVQQKVDFRLGGASCQAVKLSQVCQMRQLRAIAAACNPCLRVQLAPVTAFWHPLAQSELNWQAQGKHPEQAPADRLLVVPSLPFYCVYHSHGIYRTSCLLSSTACSLQAPPGFMGYDEC